MSKRKRQQPLILSDDERRMLRACFRRNSSSQLDQLRRTSQCTVVAVEGVDGSGKTTFVDSLRGHLWSMGIHTVVLDKHLRNKLDRTDVARERLKAQAPPFVDLGRSDLNAQARERVFRHRMEGYSTILTQLLSQPQGRPWVLILDRYYLSAIVRMLNSIPLSVLNKHWKWKRIRRPVFFIRRAVEAVAGTYLIPDYHFIFDADPARVQRRVLHREPARRPSAPHSRQLRTFEREVFWYRHLHAVAPRARFPNLID